MHKLTAMGYKVDIGFLTLSQKNLARASMFFAPKLTEPLLLETLIFADRTILCHFS